MSHVRLCRHCKKPFFPRTRKQLHCTVECRLTAAKQIAAYKRAERIVEHKQNACVYTPRPPRPPKPKRVSRVRLTGSLKESKQYVIKLKQYNDRRAKIIAELDRIKLASGCVDCGYNADAGGLQFDHVRGVKIKGVSQFTTLAGALAEAEKCDVRCAICHMIKTWREKREQRHLREARDLTILNTPDSN